VAYLRYYNNICLNDLKKTVMVAEVHAASYVTEFAAGCTQSVIITDRQTDGRTDKVSRLRESSHRSDVIKGL
jgi:hypothetical protein